MRESEDYVSGQELCNRFGVSRSAVWKAVNQLKKEGYEQVKSSGTVKEALELSMSWQPEFAILDVMLPGLDGFQVMESVKDSGVPVIYLTAVQDVAHKVQGLKSGAEDYIVKPFEALELLARIELVMKRHHKAETVLAYGDITLDAERHTVEKGGQAVALSPKEFDVLVFFIRHQDIVISRERLLSAVWDYAFEGETRTVDTHVQQVRRKLGLQGRLVTVPTYGYKLLKM